MRIIVLIFFAASMAQAGNAPSAPQQPETISHAPVVTPGAAVGTVHIAPIITVHNENTGSAASTSSSHSYSTSASEAYTFVKNTTRNAINSLQQAYQNYVPESVKNSAALLNAHIRKYPILYSIGTCYGTLFASLIAGNHYVSNDRRWAHFKKELSLAELYSFTHKQLAHELIHEIQRRYLNPKNPTDFLSPLITFMNEIDQEVSRTRWYVRIATAVTRCHLTLIFPINQHKLEQARNSLERLHFIKHIFVSWAGEYNIGQAMK